MPSSRTNSRGKSRSGSNALRKRRTVQRKPTSNSMTRRRVPSVQKKSKSLSLRKNSRSFSPFRSNRSNSGKSLRNKPGSSKSSSSSSSSRRPGSAIVEYADAYQNGSNFKVNNPMQYNYKPKSYKSLEVGYDDAYSPQKKFMGSNPMQNKRESVELKEQGDILREGAEYDYQFLKPENFRKLLVQPKNF